MPKVHAAFSSPVRLVAVAALTSLEFAARERLGCVFLRLHLVDFTYRLDASSKSHRRVRQFCPRPGKSPMPDGNLVFGWAWLTSRRPPINDKLRHPNVVEDSSEVRADDFLSYTRWMAAFQQLCAMISIFRGILRPTT